MKRLLTTAMLLTLLCLPVNAANKEEPLKYELVLTITYNALTPDEYGKVVTRSLKEHKDACNIRISGKKIMNEGMVIFSSGTTWSTVPSDSVNETEVEH